MYDKKYERPLKLYQADLIDMAAEQLSYMQTGWILEHGKDVPEDVKNFIEWWRAELKKELHCKRGQDGKSFYERREESKKAIREHSDAIMRDMQHRKDQREQEEIARIKAENPELDEWDIKQGYYLDERLCKHCDTDTKHRCKDSGHERDSSGDYQECLVCKWWMTGYSYEYNPPMGD